MSHPVRSSSRVVTPYSLANSKSSLSSGQRCSSQDITPKSMVTILNERADDDLSPNMKLEEFEQFLAMLSPTGQVEEQTKLKALSLSENQTIVKLLTEYIKGVSESEARGYTPFCKLVNTISKLTSERPAFYLFTNDLRNLDGGIDPSSPLKPDLVALETGSDFFTTDRIAAYDARKVSRTNIAELVQGKWDRLVERFIELVESLREEVNFDARALNQLCVLWQDCLEKFKAMSEKSERGWEWQDILFCVEMKTSQNTSETPQNTSETLQNTSETSQNTSRPSLAPTSQVEAVISGRGKRASSGQDVGREAKKQKVGDTDLNALGIPPLLAQQSGKYARACMNLAPNRKFVFSPLVRGTELWLSYHDRAGSVYSPVINFGPDGQLKDFILMVILMNESYLERRFFVEDFVYEPSNRSIHDFDDLLTDEWVKNAKAEFKRQLCEGDTIYPDKPPAKKDKIKFWISPSSEIYNNKPQVSKAKKSLIPYIKQDHGTIRTLQDRDSFNKKFPKTSYTFKLKEERLGDNGVFANVHGQLNPPLLVALRTRATRALLVTLNGDDLGKVLGDKSNLILEGRKEKWTPLVLKSSWISDDREKEYEIIADAEKALTKVTNKLTKEQLEVYQIGPGASSLVQCLPRVLYGKDVVNLKSVLEPRGSFEELLETDGYEINRVLVSELLHPIYLLDELEDYKEAMRHVVKGIHFLAISEQKIMHRDISRQNLMCRRVNGKVNGVLIDFDLASTGGSMLKNHKGVRTGTRPFMAVSLHLGRGQNEIPEHRERFDLESIFYVMYWDAQFYDKGKKVVLPGSVAQNSYNNWITYDDVTAIAVKESALKKSNPDNTAFFRPLRSSWLTPLGKLFHIGYGKLDEVRDGLLAKEETLGKDWEIEGFDYDTLHGNVTFEKIWDIMKV